MAVVTDSDVAAAVLTRWAAVSALNAIIPSTGVWRGRATERSTLPYATVVVTEQDRELTSGSAYLATFLVEIEAYTNDTGTTTAALSAALDAAFNGSSSAPAAGLSVTNATAVLYAQADGGATSRPTANERSGGSKDTRRTTAKYRVLVQGSRG